MAKISVDSGEFRFDADEQPIPAKSGSVKVLVLGGFSGSSNSARNGDSSLLRRPHYRLDKDNFDEVFSKLNVRLQLPFSTAPIFFDQYEDLHPDHLYQNIPLFDRFKVLLNKIKKPKLFASVVEELISEGIVAEALVSSQEVGTQSGEGVDAGFLLDSLLSSPSVVADEGQIQSLIRETIAPYVEPKEHPKVEEYSRAIESSINQVMRKLMHDSAFQQLEASWRSLDLMNRRLDTDTFCKLHIMDVDQDEILDDLDRSGDSLESSSFFRNVVDSNAVAGGQAYDVILVDLPMQDEKSLKLLSMIADVASKIKASVLVGKNYQSFCELNKDGQQREDWACLRAKPSSKSVYMATPNFMLRLPYGSKSSRIDEFEYEELPVVDAQRYYLWGSSAYLLLLAFVRSAMAESDASIVESLPIHVYKEGGETFVQPSAEQYLTEKEVAQLESFGATAVQSVMNSDRVLMAHLQPAFS